MHIKTGGPFGAACFYDIVTSGTTLRMFRLRYVRAACSHDVCRESFRNFEYSHQKRCPPDFLSQEHTFVVPVKRLPLQGSFFIEQRPERPIAN